MPAPSTFFRPDGPAASVIDGFRARVGQAQMADTIANAIDSGEDLLIEAGTGTGKTFAYLLPLVLSGKRVIVSTATRTLQDQLWQWDLPRVKAMAGVNARFALLKGRANYACPQRLHRHIAHLPAYATELASRLTEVRQWLSRSRTGDLSEFLDTESESTLLPLVTSTSDNCLGKRCRFFDECPVYRARERAAEADVLIVNHHLLFSDMALHEESLTPLLPRADVVLMDEAHRAAAIARQFFGRRLSSRQFLELVHEALTEFDSLGAEDIGVREGARELEAAVRRLGSAWSEGQYDADAIEDVDLGFSALIASLDVVRTRSAVYEQCYSRALKYADLFALLTDITGDEDGYARWRNVLPNGGFVLHLSPVSISREFGERIRNAEQTWIMTSATLSVDGSFEHVVNDLGLGDIATATYESPFDFESQVTAWIPPLLSAPGTRDHTQELIEQCLPLLKGCRGRAFLLFTSHRALQDAAERLLQVGCVNLLVQGSASRTALLEQFRRTPRAALLATQSFWEGVDVRGADLRLLIVDKLPFPSPDDPLICARSHAIEAEGMSSFDDLMLPEAVTGLRQGFGRLIREESDRGVFVLGDPRVRTRGYGSAVRNSLPTMKWLASVDDAVEALTS